MKLIPAIGLFLVVTLITACGSPPAPVVRFPETGEVPGWTKAGEIRTFPADRLWEYIDGDAEKYIRAGVSTTLTADFRYQDRLDATADIFVMSTADGARQIFDSEPAAGGSPVAIGDAGRSYRASLLFRKGPYFVRLVAYEDTPEVESALLALGRAIAAGLD